MFRLVLTNIFKRPVRSVLTAGGIAIALAVILLIDQIGASYRTQLTKELNSMGLHLMLVPLGCPYDAAARVLQGATLETSLPDSAVEIARSDRDVEIAAPLLIAAVPRPREGRTDMFVGLDESAIDRVVPPGDRLGVFDTVGRAAGRFGEEDLVVAEVARRELGQSRFERIEKSDAHG